MSDDSGTSETSATSKSATSADGKPVTESEPAARPNCWPLERDEVVRVGDVAVPIILGVAVIDGIELRITCSRKGRRWLRVYPPPGKVMGFDRVTATADRPAEFVILVRGYSTSEAAKVPRAGRMPLASSRRERVSELPVNPGTPPLTFATAVA